MDEKIDKCRICKTDASITCKPCQQYFCKKCVGQHVITEKGIKHEVVPYIHVDSELVLPYCGEHINRRCELKCRECQIHVCPMCVTTNHEEHTLDNIESLVKEKKKSIINEISEIEASSLDLSKTEKEVNENLEFMNDNLGLVFSQMEEQSSDLKRTVDEIVCECRNSVENATLENKAPLLKFLEKIRTKKENLQIMIKEKTKILDSTVATNILDHQTNCIGKRNIPPLLNFAPAACFTHGDKSREALHDYLGKLSLTTCSPHENALYVKGKVDECAQGVDELSIKQNEVFVVDRQKYYEEEDDRITAIRLSDGSFGFVQRDKIFPSRSDFPHQFQEWWLPVGTSDAERILSPSNVDVGTFCISEESDNSFTLSIKISHFEEDDTVAHITVSKLNDSGAVYIKRDNVFPDLQSLIEFYQKSTNILDALPCKPSTTFPQQVPEKLYSGQKFQKQDLIIEDFCESFLLCSLYSGLLKKKKRVSINVFPIPKCEEMFELTHVADGIIEEAELMRSFSDKHVLQVIGVVSSLSPLIMITEPITGSLLSYCWNVEYFSENEIFIIVEQIIKGMQYIHKQGFAHGCLCAESILLGEHKEIKIGQFQFTKYLAIDPVLIHGKLPPVRWSPPELLLQKRFGTKSDVWAFGILLYEIFTLGSQPYTDLEDDEIGLQLENGFRLPKPRGTCSEHYYHIMQLCWSKEESRRPTFSELENEISHENQPSGSEEIREIQIQLQECWLPLGKEKAEELLLREDIHTGTYLICEALDEKRSFTLSLKYVENSQLPDVAHIEIVKSHEESSLYYIDCNACFNSISTLLKYYQGVEISELYGRLKEPYKHETSLIPFTGFEIDRTTITLSGKIEICQRYDIYEGRLQSAKRYSVFIYKLPKEEPVAEDSSYRLGDDAVQEALNLCKFSDETILEIFGMCSISCPFVIVTDFVNCTLLHHVRKYDVKFTSQEITNALVKIANGVMFLHQSNFCHKDLCASNIFLGERNTLKVGGLHFAEYLQCDPMMISKIASDDVPFQSRWCAPEILQRRQFGSKSDLWSFGVVIFEIVSKGEIPYKNLIETEVKEKVTNGYRMPRHKECTDDHHEIMQLCWKEDLSSRPTFQSLKQKLINLRPSKSFLIKKFLPK